MPLVLTLLSERCGRERTERQHRVSWIDPPAALAHVPSDGRAVMLERSVDITAAQLGRDGAAYRALMQPLAERSRRSPRCPSAGPLRIRSPRRCTRSSGSSGCGRCAGSPGTIPKRLASS
jgi:hypothetical protein